MPIENLNKLINYWKKNKMCRWK